MYNFRLLTFDVEINWFSMKILMVCLGNICRSPIAEGILRSKAQEKQLAISVDSAGTIGIHAGEQPDKRMQVTALNFGIDISPLKSRQVTLSDFEEFDRIYAMDESNYNDLVQLAKQDAHIQKIKLILEENPKQTIKNVPDPYYGGQDGFNQVYHLLDDAIEHLVKKLEHESR